MAKLDPTVQVQVLRRGGLRSGPKIDPKSVDGRVAQLRSQVKADKDEKRQDGPTPKEGAAPKDGAAPKAKPKGKAKVGWAVPEDYQGPVAQLEQELGELGQGPNFSWHEAFSEGIAIDSQPLDC